MGPELNEVDLGQAVESKKRDNLALGEALLSIGLIGHGELRDVRSAQGASRFTQLIPLVDAYRNSSVQQQPSDLQATGTQALPSGTAFVLRTGGGPGCQPQLLPMLGRWGMTAA